MTTRRYTSVLIVFERDRINVRLRFARPVRERRLDRRRRLALFVGHTRRHRASREEQSAHPNTELSA